MFEHIRIRSRRRLIGAMIAAQLLTLGAGGLAIYYLVEERLAESVQARIYRQNESVARSVSRLIQHELGAGHHADPAHGWQHVQNLVEDTVLADGAHVSVLDKRGEVLCRAKRLSVSGARLADAPVTIGERTAALGSIDPAPIVHGRTTIAGEHQFVTIASLPAIGGKLVVHQPASGLDVVGSATTGGIMWLVGAMMVVIAGVTVLFGTAIVRRYDSRVEELNRDLEVQVIRRTRDSVARLHALIHGLAQLADRRDNETGSHLERICAYSCLLAEAIRDDHDEVDDDWISCLRLAASMHDIGKVGVPDSILLKPGKLTESEWDLIRRHPVTGASTLEQVHEKLGGDPLIEMAIEVTRSHHERWDGSGYPDGKAGEDIPLAARIVAVADVYDALTSKRVYKGALTHHEAVEVVVAGAGSQFDPRLVEAFEQIEPIFDSIRRGLQDQPTPAAGPESERRVAA